MLLVAVIVFGSMLEVSADLGFLEVPPGYTSGTIPLGRNNSATALAADPMSAHHIYAAGTFDGRQRIVRVSIRTGRWWPVFDCPSTVSVAGLAVLLPSRIFVSDNFNDRLYLLWNSNHWEDRDFDDPGEARELIEPILTDDTYGWTGSAIAIVPSSNNRLGLAAGTVLFQSEDGGTTQGEVLAVADPLTSPTYQPQGGAYFAGFDYGGGLAIDSKGRLLAASSSYPRFGAVYVCEDLSGDGAIGPGESNAILRSTDAVAALGLSALAIDPDGRGYITTALPVRTGPMSDIRVFDIPDDALHTTTTMQRFATIQTAYVSSVVFAGSGSFRAGEGVGATMVIAATDENYMNPDYLLTLRPVGLLGVRSWRHYK